MRKPAVQLFTNVLACERDAGQPRTIVARSSSASLRLLDGLLGSISPLSARTTDQETKFRKRQDWLPVFLSQTIFIALVTAG
ncbi:unnamed protein product [Protopolystoma xenopodis]|uniref:Uncharacterized protein n=1 Tax=Protopolystoma xenopodis TaxID=117903 RepID=A0A3S5AVD9_9PLAT|nr:unnamed protein product [Protopolystoma xenopodis]